MGRAGLTVSPFCLGVVTDPDMVPRAFDAGINFFFLSADMHWPVYRETRRGLERLLERGPHVRDAIVVAVASYLTQPAFCGGTFLEVLGAIPNLDRIDVLVAGGAGANEFLTRRERYRTVPYAEALGHRATAASFHDRSTALTAINHALVDLAFIRYNPEHPGARRDLFAGLRSAPEALPCIYNFRSMIPTVSPARARELGLHDDHWLPAPADAYRFALSRPEVSGILGALNAPSELDDLVAALEQGPLDDDEQEYFIQLAALNAGRARVVAAP